MTGDHGYDDELFEDELYVVDGLDEEVDFGTDPATEQIPGRRHGHAAADELDFEAELEQAADEAELFGDDQETTAASTVAQAGSGVADPWSHAASKPGASTAADEDDVLFAAPIAGSEFDTELPTFQEHGQSNWGGAHLSPEQMGLPVEEQEPLPALDAVQEVDIEVDPNDVAFVVEESPGDAEQDVYGTAADMAAQDAGTLLHDGGGAPDEGWEDIDITQLEGSEHAGSPYEHPQAEQGEYEQQLVEASEEFAESYAETDGVEGQVLELPRRRRALRWVAGLAAALLAAAGGTYWYAPEYFEPVRGQIVRWLPWLEQRPEQIEVVQLPRPQQDPIELQPVTPDPVAPAPPPVDPDPTPSTDPATDPITRPVVNLDPAPVVPRTREDLAREAGRKLRALLGSSLPAPADQRPLPQPDPLAPANLDPVAAADPVAAPDGTQSLLPVGEDVMFSKLPDQTPKGPQIPTMAQGIVTGSQALAQLHNGNFFVGRVKLIEATFVTLRLEKGEVTLNYDDLELLTIVGTAEYERLKMAEKAYVRLSNNNTLSGRLLAGGAEGEVILEMRSSRVVIPIKAIEEIGKESMSGYRVTDDADDTWIQMQAEEKLNEVRRPQPIQDPSTPPKPQGN